MRLAGVQGMLSSVNDGYLIVALSASVFWATTWTGQSLRATDHKLEGEDREEFLFILGGTLTLWDSLLASHFPWP